MTQSEDTEKGLFAISLDDSGENILRFGRMRYNGSYRLWMSDCVLPFGSFIAYLTKKEAVAAAKRLGWPATHVERVGSRFWSAWGIRHDHRDQYFLAIYE